MKCGSERRSGKWQEWGRVKIMKRDYNEKERNPTREEKIFIFIHSDFDITYPAAVQKCWTLCCPGAINFLFSDDILSLIRAEPFIQHCIMKNTWRRCNDASLGRPVAGSETEGKVKPLVKFTETSSQFRHDDAPKGDSAYVSGWHVRRMHFNSICFNSNDIQGSDEQRGCSMAYSPAQGENMWSIQQFLVIIILTTGI